MIDPRGRARTECDDEPSHSWDAIFAIVFSIAMVTLARFLWAMF